MSKKSGGKIYYSFDEIGQEVFGLKPYTRVTRDKQKLESQREKFLGTCPHCKQPLKYIYGTNILACENEKCRGRKITIVEEDGENYIYKPYYKILSDKGSVIGTTIFEEKER
jgi:hypothetical protein